MPQSSMEEIRAELASIRAEQASRRAKIEAAEARIAALEQRMDRILAAAGPQAGSPLLAVTGTNNAQSNDAPDRSAPAASATFAATDAQPRPDPLRGLDIGGDIRVRYEANFGDSGIRDRGRGVLRARLRAAYAVNDWLTVGGQLATGDPDDPNTADLSFSSFDDDLEFSLDQVFIHARTGNWDILGGKFVNPVERTELVWDGDVNPEGGAVSYRFPLGKAAALKLTGMYLMIDEQTDGPESSMIGGQATLFADLADSLRISLAGSYYDYRLDSVAGADAGDFRTNLRGPDGFYLSDFNLVNIVAGITYSGLGDRWPVVLTGDYVKNMGAATRADTGFGAALLIGRTNMQGDWRFGYNYMTADTDAVFAAFSNDNLTLATNYYMHALTADFVAWNGVVLNATYYRYRVKDPLGPGIGQPDDWRDRVRLNFLVNF